MKLCEIRIENFRSIQDETLVLDDYTCLVGSNGTGKSTVLTALNVFFRNNADTVTDVVNLNEEDFHHRNTDDPVKITLTFEDLSEEAQEDFQDYYRQGKLIIFVRADWDPAAGVAPVKQYGCRLAMPAFAPFFKARGDGVKVAELRPIYQGIREELPDLPKETAGTRMEAALRAHEKKHPEQCELIDSEDQFYGVSRGTDRLEKHIQWVYIPAIKEPSAEQEEGTKTALGQLLDRTIRARVDFDEPLDALKEELKEKYNEILDSNQELLTQLESSLRGRLREWSNPGAMLSVDWRYDPDKSVVLNQPAARISIGEDEFVGEVARVGHGLQRAFLVSILQELATGQEGSEPTLLLGFEEPELYLHPPQAQHVSNLLEHLAELPEHNSQVVVTTHSPYFVSSRGFENVRVFRKDESRRFSTVTNTTYGEIEKLLAAALSERPGTPTSLMARVAQIMQPSQRELFFTNLAVLVEGPEDVAFLSTYLHLTDKWDDFRRRGCHFIVCECKTNMSRPLAIALRLGIPAFAVFDSDVDTGADRQAPDRVNANRRDNSCLLALSAFCETGPDEIDVTDIAAVPDDEALSADTLWHPTAVMFSPDIGAAVREDFGPDVWAAAEQEARNKRGLVNGVRRKNPMVIASTLEQLWADSKRSQVLAQACDAILAAAPASSET